MLKYRITFSSSDEAGMKTREVECRYIKMPDTYNELIYFYGESSVHPVLAVNPANVAQLELLEGDPVVEDNKTFDSADGPPEN